VDEGAYNRTLEQIMNVFIRPELARRRADESFELRAAQVVLPGDGSAVQVRLNEEARFQVTLKAGVVLPANPGGFLLDSSGIERLTLCHPDDANFGHFTILWCSPGPFLSFDARRNKAIVANLIATSGEFLQSARHAEGGLKSWSVCVDNSYSSLELSIKAFLWTLPHGLAFKPNMAHKEIRRALKTFPTTANKMDRIVATFDLLLRERYKARYLHEPFTADWKVAAQWLKDVEAMLNRAVRQTQPGAKASLLMPVWNR
jgi:hypothetical protein